MMDPRARCALRTLAGLALLAASCAAGAVSLSDWFGGASAHSSRERGRNSEEALARLAQQMNRGLPQQIDPDFRLEQVSAEPKAELVYHYTMLQLKKSQVPPDWLELQAAPVIRERMCADSRLLRVLASGATVSYAYRDQQGAEIGKLSFRQRDCSGKG